MIKKDAVNVSEVNSSQFCNDTENNTNKVLTDSKSKFSSGFYSLKISPKLLTVLDNLKFTIPTPIQQKAIPKLMAGTDLIGIAQTGTGKTLAFALPMLQKLTARKEKGLVLVPTRELAFQAAEVINMFAAVLNLKTLVIVGGESGSVQYRKLKEKPDIIIATPGRLIDHINQKNLSLSDTKILVLDEADRMLDMGFEPQIHRIVSYLPEQRQTMLFSATMPNEIINLTKKYMKNPARVEVTPQGTASTLVNQELYIVDRDKKLELLSKILDKYWGSVLLFVRTKHNAKKITKQIIELPHSAAEIHSNRSLNQRKEALAGFKSGKYRILVATDIAARGIDVTGIELVINYDLPDESENYVHRIGRTGRAGNPGHSITFATPDQGHDITDIEKITKTNLKLVTIPDFTLDKFVQPTGARPKGEKRLARKFMAGSENDPVKKPRNIFAARRRERALKRVNSTMGNNPSNVQNTNNIQKNVLDIKPLKVETKQECNNIPVQNKEKINSQNNRNNSGKTKQSGFFSQRDQRNNRNGKQFGKENNRYRKTRHNEENRDDTARYDKDYKPKRRSIIMSSAYFDDAPGKSYYGEKNGRNNSRKSHSKDFNAKHSKSFSGKTFKGKSFKGKGPKRFFAKNGTQSFAKKRR